MKIFLGRFATSPQTTLPPLIGFMTIAKNLILKIDQLINYKNVNFHRYYRLHAFHFKINIFRILGKHERCLRMAMVKEKAAALLNEEELATFRLNKSLSSLSCNHHCQHGHWSSS